MPTFRYKVRDRTGTPSEGVMEGESAAAVVSRLRERDFYVIKVEEEQTSAFSKEINLEELKERFGRKIQVKDLALFCRQFSTLINAGVPLYNGLVILKEQMQNPAFRKVLDQVADDLRQGRTFTAAVERHPRVFPEIFVHMVEAGELGGVLDEVLERMAVHFEKENEIQGKVKSATTYPLVILVVALGAVAFILGFVMPTFAGMLTGFGAELPAMTKFVLGLSEAVQSYWWAGLIGLGLMLFGASQAIKKHQVRYIIDKVSLKLPIFGDILVKVAVSRFSRTLGTLMRSGVPLMQALDVVQKTVGNLAITEGVRKAQESISQGRGMAGPLQQSGVFPSMVVQMVSVGEETGALDTLLEKIADYYDMEVNNVVGRLSTIIEPIMMVVLGGIVGFLVVSMLLPMFELITNVGNQ